MRIKINKRVLLFVVLSLAIVGLSYLVWQKVREERKYRGNILKNFSFETVDTSGKLPLWAEDSRGGWSVSKEDPYQGERCMQGTVGWSWFWQVAPARGRRYYTLRAYIKSDIVIDAKTSYGNTFLTLECLDEKGRIIRSDYGIVNALSFWQQKVRQIYAPAGTIAVKVKLAKRQGEGSIWFDDIELEESPSALLYNSGFEAVNQLGRLDAWTEDAKEGWLVSTEESYEGERSVQATVPWSWLSQEIPVRPERYYTLKGYLKSNIALTEGKDDWNAFLVVQCLDEERKVIVEQIGQLKAAPFWELGQTGLYAPEKTDKIRLKLAKRQGEGSVWFDNLDIIESAWYMRVKFLRRIMDDKPFFVFYFAIYFVLLISLIRLIVKRQSIRERAKE